MFGHIPKFAFQLYQLFAGKNWRYCDGKYVAIDFIDTASVELRKESIERIIDLINY